MNTIEPNTYPSFRRLSACELTVRDPETGFQVQISVDDLYEAFKEQLRDGDGFVTESMRSW